MAAKASNVADKSSLGMNEYVYQSVTVQVGLLLWWLDTKQTIVNRHRREEEEEVLL